MGLSKKLGGTSHKTGLPPSDTVLYKWSNQTYTVPEIVKRFKLPCVVQCVTDSCTVVWSDFQFDLRQPLLLYSQRSVQKVHAVCLKQNNDILEEIGPPLAIPEDYDGWFGAAPKGTSKAKRHFRIEAVANSAAPRLLVTSKCPAFTTSYDSSGNLQYVPRDILPGEVLKRVSVINSDIMHPDCSDIVIQHGPCMECLDEKDEDVVIPLSHAAITYEVSENYPEDESKVFQITTPIAASNSKLPRILNLVYGNPPLLAYTFTNMIRCYSIFTEETILAATMEDPESRCLELATDSCAKFRIGLNEAAVKKTCEYVNANQMCENFGAKFVTGIKVSFKLKPIPPNVGDSEASFYESASDMQEVEATSEFDIAWGSARKAKDFIESESLEKSNSSSQDRTISEHKEIKGEIIQKVTDKMTTDFVKTDSDISLVPEHHDLTDRDIVNLMLKKELMNHADEENKASAEIDLLEENCVTDNPLFYFFQRNPEQSPWKAKEPENDSLSSEDSEYETNIEENHQCQENSNHRLIEETPASTKLEAKLPLSYPFELKPLTKDIAVSESVPNIKNTLKISSSVDLHSGPLGLTPDVDSFQYDHIVCKPAMVYTGAEDDSDDDDDASENEEGEEHYECSDSDGNCSEVSDLSCDIEQVSYPSGIDIPDNILAHVDTSSGSNYSQKPENKLYLSNVGETITDNKTDGITNLLSSTKTHSGKCSTSNIPEHQIWQQNGKYTMAQLGKNCKGDAVDRLNSLIAEVSELVNTSSDRILDGNKGYLHQQQDIVSEPVINHGTSQTISKSTDIKSNTCTSTVSRAVTVSESTLSNFTDTLLIPHANSSTPLLRQSEPLFERNLYKSNDSTFNFDNAFNSSPKINEFNPQDNVSILTRSNAKSNLMDIAQDSINDTFTPGKMHKLTLSESAVSSIFTAIKKQKNILNPSKVINHPHGYQHPLPNKINYPIDQCHSPNIFSNEDIYPFPYKNQRILSLTSKRNGLKSDQNFEHLNSTSDSMSTSSNYNSSLDNSFIQSAPKLVVIGDTDLVLENNHHFINLNYVHSSTHQSESSGVSASKFSNAESCGEIMNKGYTKWSQIGSGQMSQGKCVPIQNGDDDLLEDYV